MRQVVTIHAFKQIFWQFFLPNFILIHLTNFSNFFFIDNYFIFFSISLFIFLDSWAPSTFQIHLTFSQIIFSS
jgi:hypothetical protein